MKFDIYEHKRFRITDDCRFGSGEQFIEGEMGIIIKSRPEGFFVKFDIQVYDNDYFIFKDKIEVINNDFLSEEDFIL